MPKDLYQTQLFKNEKNDSNIKDIIEQVYSALDERGYDPINQIIGYILSGDPTYITSFNDARKIIRQIERDDLLEEILCYYIESNNIKSE